ncbi:MAG TPA: 30S ribosomal protein S9 [Bacteroidota bacterium]|nr:30S ribosomal protein S9 [Bacteroidota bacterium]
MSSSAIGTGRRKTSVARVRLLSGTGKVVINDRPFESYFPLEISREKILAPLSVTDNLGKYDVYVNVFGGGTTGQVEAIRLGIARSLVQINEEYRTILREKGFLTRDPRMVERKKYGQRKARKRFQFSKR